MKKKMQFLSTLCAVVLIAGLFTGCANKTPAPEENNDNNETVGLLTESFDETNEIVGDSAEGQVSKIVAALKGNSFSPAPFQAPSVGTAMQPFVYASLITQPYTGALLPDCEMWVAKEVTQVDEYTYDIEIYDYVTDSKGNHITADDILFSFDMSASLGQMVVVPTYVESLTKTGEYSLQLKLNTTMPGILETILSNTQLCIVDQEWYENASDDEKQNDPAATGAYRVASFVPGSSITFEALDEYWQSDDLVPSAAKRNVKVIEYRAITEAAMRSIALENGEVDEAEIKASDLERFYENGTTKDGWFLKVKPGTNVMSAFINMESGKSVLSDNLELRKAVLYAISGYDLMLANGENELTGTELDAFALKTYEGYQDVWDTQDYFDFSIDTAKEYLEKAGYKPGEVTIRVLTSTQTNNDSFRSVLISNLQLAGFNVDSLAVDQALFNTYKYDSTQWDVLIDTKGSTAGNVAGLFDTCFNPAGYSNGSVCFTHDDELVRLLMEADTANDSESLQAFHSYITDNAIVKGLYTYGSLYVLQDGVWAINLTYGFAPEFQSATYAADYASVTEK